MYLEKKISDFKLSHNSLVVSKTDKNTNWYLPQLNLLLCIQISNRSCLKHHRK